MSYAEIKEPKLTKDGRAIVLELKQKRNGFLGIGSTSGRLVSFDNNEITNRIFAHLISVYEIQ